MVMLKKQSSTQGFGLIELIVSISIVTIVTGIVMARHSAFNGAILLRNQAYEIAFIIREAQQLAVSGQTSDLEDVQKQRYGVALSTDPSGEVNRQTLILYKDSNNDGVYNTASGNSDQLIQTYRLDRRFQIVSLTDPSSANSHSSMRVLFERPLFDAKFYRDSGHVINTGPVRIVVEPVANDAGGVPQRVITVSSSGQVAVLENN